MVFVYSNNAHGDKDIYTYIDGIDGSLAVATSTKSAVYHREYDRKRSRSAVQNEILFFRSFFKNEMVSENALET